MTEKVIRREEKVYTNGNEVPRSQETVVRETVATHSDRRANRRAILKVDQTLWLFLSMLEVLLGMRVFLKLIAANPASGFAKFIYGVSDVFLLPFYGLTQTPSANGSTLEIFAIIAMIVYAILFWFAVYIVHLLGER
ncbi:MAG: YggT family protein [Ardenticatenaceae bacterium]|nr:YggT family protein [Ardenticatenaceae bacterium]